VHLVGYFHSCITMHGFMNVKSIRALLCIFNVGVNNKTYFGSACKVPTTLTDFNKIWNFLTEFLKRPQNQIRSVGVALTHADRRTDITRVTGAFHDNANVSKNIRKRKLSFICYRKCVLKKA
jgi:hypothetical protein